MTELREADLRFSVDEANQFLNQVQGLRLSNEDVQALKDRTEGWIAGLHLASITLKGKDNPAEYIRGFAGSHEYIADYLTEEVINQQAEHIQDFLLKTSLLDRFCSSLCENITGDVNSYQILKQLREDNLFLVSLDDTGQWFRYHRLFVDLLGGRLLESQPEMVPHLYLKASVWFEGNDYLDEAVDYAIRGSHFERAANLIEEGAEPTLMRSEIATFIRWVEKLPEELIIEKEVLCIYYAWALLVRGEGYQTAEYYLDQFEPGDGRVSGQLKAVKSILFFSRRQIPEATKLARQALDQLPDDEHFFRQIAAWNLSALLFISGDQKGGAKMLEEVARVSLASSNLLVAIVALCRLGSYQMLQGNLNLATRLFEQALSIRPGNQTQPLPAACEALLGLGKVAWERYELDIASKYLLDGIELSKRWREMTDIDSYVTLAHIRQSQGDVAVAVQLIEKAKKHAEHTLATDTDDQYVDSQGALLLLHQGDIQAVERWAVARGLERYLVELDLDGEEHLGAGVILRYELIIFTRLLLAKGRFEEALGLLKKLLPSVERLGHQSKIFEVRTLIAIGLQAVGDIEGAMSAINGVLTAAEREGFKRVFMDEGALVSSLIEESVSQGFDSLLAKDVLASMKGKRVELGPLEMAGDLVEPLSDREMQVLRMLESRLSTPEIAGHLHIAVSTLRTHIKNIYSKLGVHSRFEAVSKARDLNLI
jgi:LuxR family maltose regulon positive regulatory protein